MANIKLVRGTLLQVITTGAAPGNATLASGAYALSAEYDNQSNLWPFADIEITPTFSVAPTAGSQLLLYLIPANDGTNYTDGSGSVLPADSLLIAWTSLRAVTTAQRLTFRPAAGFRVELPPSKFYLLLKNDSDQTISASWTVTVFPHGWSVT